MNITLCRQPDAGQEILSMLSRLAKSRQNGCSPEDNLIRVARKHYLSVSNLAGLKPALNALAELEAHVLSGIEPDDAHLSCLFTGPQSATAPVIYLYDGLRYGYSAEQCAQKIVLSLQDEERLPHAQQEMTLDAFVRHVSSLDIDRDYMLNLTQMLAFWEDNLAWLSGLLERAIPLYEEKADCVQPLIDVWAEDMEARLSQMQETGRICSLLQVQNAERPYVLVPALIHFASLFAFNPTPDGTQYIHYGVLLDAIARALPEIGDSQLITRLRALGDKRRMTIVRALAEHPRYAGEIAALTRLSPATVSHHMTELLEAQLITAEDVGARVGHHLSQAGPGGLIDGLNALL